MHLARRAAGVVRSGGQIAVSCQSGRGRSGTFAALVVGDLQSIRSHDELVDAVVGLREHRDGLVETPAQLRFVADTLGLPSTADCGLMCTAQHGLEQSGSMLNLYLVVTCGCLLLLLPLLYLRKQRQAVSNKADAI